MVLQGIESSVPFIIPVIGFLSLGAKLLGIAVISGAGSILGAREQRKANDRANNTLERIEREKLGLSREQFEESKRLIAEGKPVRDALREAGLKTIPALTETALQALTGIQQDLSREPGTGELFTTGLRRGIEARARELGAFGIDRSAFARSTGELTEGLVANDIQSIRNLRLQASGFAPGPGESTLGPGVGLGNQAVGLQGQAGQIGTARANLQSQSPTAGLFRDLAQVGSTIATTAALNKFGKPTPAGGR